MSANAETLYRRYKARAGAKALALVLAVFLLAIVMAAGLCVGASGMGSGQVLVSLFKNTGRDHGIVWLIRLPRIVLAALVGFGMGMAGAVFQAVLRNPLASPFTLGVGSAAGFGAVSVILFLGGGFQTYRVASGAFLFTLLSAALILAVARMKSASSETMILTGIAQMFLFSALTSLFQYMGTMEQVNEVVFWFFGSLSKAGWPEIGLAAAMILGPVSIFAGAGLGFQSPGLGGRFGPGSGGQCQTAQNDLRGGRFPGDCRRHLFHRRHRLCGPGSPPHHAHGHR